MNKDHAKGQAKLLAGKVQEAAGKLVNSKSQEAKGLKLQSKGKAQQATGDTKEALKEFMR